SVRVHPCLQDFLSGKIITGYLPVRLRPRSRDTRRTTPSSWWITYSSSHRRNSVVWPQPWVARELPAIHLRENARQPQRRVPLRRVQRHAVARWISTVLD